MNSKLSWFFFFWKPRFFATTTAHFLSSEAESLEQFQFQAFAALHESFTAVLRKKKINNQYKKNLARFTFDAVHDLRNVSKSALQIVSQLERVCISKHQTFVEGWRTQKLLRQKLFQQLFRFGVLFFVASVHIERQQQLFGLGNRTSNEQIAKVNVLQKRFCKDSEFWNHSQTATEKPSFPNLHANISTFGAHLPSFQKFSQMCAVVEP